MTELTELHLNAIQQAQHRNVFGDVVTDVDQAAKECANITLSYTEDRVKELEEQVNTWKNIDKRHVETILELSREVEALKGKLEVVERELHNLKNPF